MVAREITHELKCHGDTRKFGISTRIHRCLRTFLTESS
jgi:hypothetical protein